MVLVPDRVTTLTITPDDCPYSAPKLFETTMNSLIASTEKPPRWPATESSSLLKPSIRKVLLRVSWPDEEMPPPRGAGHAGCELRQRREVAAGDRQFLDRRRGDRRAERRARGLDHRGLGGDGHGLFERANLQCHHQGDFLGDAEGEVRSNGGPEARQFRGQLIAAGCEADQPKVAGRVGDRRADLPALDVLDRDGGTRQNGLFDRRRPSR